MWRTTKRERQRIIDAWLQADENRLAASGLYHRGEIIRNHTTAVKFFISPERIRTIETLKHAATVYVDANYTHGPIEFNLEEVNGEEYLYAVFIKY